MTPMKSVKEVREAFQQGYNVVPWVREVPEDTITPVEAFLRLNPDGAPSFLLESVEGGERMARYSFLGVNPFETLTVQKELLLSRSDRGMKCLAEAQPFQALGRHLLRYRARREPGLPRFCGGAVGYLGYEMFRYLEPTVSLRESEGEDAKLMVFSDIVVFDRLRHRMLLVSNIFEGPGSLSSRCASAERRLDAMEALLRRPSRRPLLGRAAAVDSIEMRAVMGREQYCRGVLRIKKHIRAGDIFQAVLSDRFEMDLKASPFSIYRALRSINPSPYMFYMDFGSSVALGASPEMLLRSEDGVLETRPIAGTRPRGKSEEEDLRNEKNLLASVKEKAEHLMLVDLGRNDIGRVARPGSVSVPSFMQVERYSHVMHIVSSVRGKLDPRYSSWDALGACFPAGTVTGAPKIRAMQLISEIEPTPRGLYAGAAVYSDFSGNVDSAIAIRSLFVRRGPKGHKAILQAGAGLVADSQPDREYDEALNKARAMAAAIRMAEGLAS